MKIDYSGIDVPNPRLDLQQIEYQGLVMLGSDQISETVGLIWHADRHSDRRLRATPDFEKTLVFPNSC